MAPTIAGRVGFAFEDTALETDPTFTWVDQEYDNLVASWEKDVGRQFELDRTDAARATIRIKDKDGILDPTNNGGPFFASTVGIQPLVQVVLGAWNPVAAEWQQRFRGWVANWNYDQHPSQAIMQLTVEVVDIFDMLAAVEMLPGFFGDEPVPAAAGQVFYDEAAMDARIIQALTDAGIPEEFYVVFSGNVSLMPTIYSPGETPMTVVQEAADSEFSGVSNVYTDRFGRLAVHGRLAKFDPGTISTEAGTEAWDWRHWQAGDGEAVLASPTQVGQVRRFGFNRGVDTIRNSALAYPLGALDADIAGQIVRDETSIGRYGPRSWSAPNLLTSEGLLNSNTGLEETKLMAEYIVNNYSIAIDRVGAIRLRSKNLGTSGAGINFQMLTRIDIADQLDVTVLNPGGGGLTDAECFVEGIRETLEPLNDEYDDHTVELDLSPKALFTDNPFPVS